MAVADAHHVGFSAEGERVESEPSEASAPEQLFVGEGEMPRDLEAVNWGAALFSFIWVFIWGMWRWVALFAVVIALDVIVQQIPLLFLDPVRDLPRWQAVLNPLETAILLAISVTLGLRANRIVWDREQRRFEQACGDPARPIPLRRYRRSVAFWRRLGFTVLGLALVLNVFALTLKGISIRQFFVGLPLGLAPFAVLLVVDVRRRRAAARG